MASGNLRKGGGAAAALIALLIAVTAPNEGLRTKAYPDTNGIPTICYGDTHGVRLGDEKTKAECDALLRKRLKDYGKHVEECVNQPMSIETEAAFIDLAYNIGWQGLCRSAVVQLYNEGRSEESCEAILQYTHDKRGVKLRGLVRRRQENHDLCVYGLTQPRN